MVRGFPTCYYSVSKDFQNSRVQLQTSDQDPGDDNRAWQEHLGFRV